MAGGAGGGDVFPILVGHIAAGNHEPGGQSAAHRQTHHGGFHALPGSTNPHGAGSDYRWIIHRGLG